MLGKKIAGLDCMSKVSKARQPSAAAKFLVAAKPLDFLFVYYTVVIAYLTVKHFVSHFKIINKRLYNYFNNIIFMDSS